MKTKFLTTSCLFGLIFFSFSVFFDLQAQLKVLSTGAVEVGSASAAKIQSSGTLQMDVPGLTVRNTDSLGFKIYKIYVYDQTTYQQSNSSIIGPPPIYPTGSPVICLTGLSSNATYIGNSGSPITKVYAKSLYSVGGTVGSLSASDTRLKKNITKISSVRNKIKSLNVVKYDFTKTLGGEDVSNDPNYKNKTGLLAQEVKDIFPDIVYYDSTDNFYALDYSALIPYLIKSDQEQLDLLALQQETITLQQESIASLQNQVSELQEQIGSLQKQSPSKTETTNKTHRLFQNAPNPFNQSTKIEYVLSENVSSAKLCVYDLNGKQLRCFVLNTAKGTSSIEVRASDLTAGIYLYTLIVDNMPIDTKRMILTE
jgi:hypothetical protein